MTHIEYFKRQAKKLFRDYQTKKPYFDEVIDDYMYEYSPKYFDIDEDDFCLMKAQHIIAIIAGFKEWTNLIKASEIELQLARLLFDNQDKVCVDDWLMYITGVERDNITIFSSEEKIEISNMVFINEKAVSCFTDLRLHKKE